MQRSFLLKQIVLFLVIVSAFVAQKKKPVCPSQHYSIISSHIKIAISGDINITSKDTYCYGYSLEKSFQNLPSVAVALSQFQSQPTNNLFLSIKYLPLSQCSMGSSQTVVDASSLTSLSFSVNLYQQYTKWTMVDFYFLAEDKPEIETGYYLVDPSNLAQCNAGKSQQINLPFINQQLGEIEAYTFLHGFEISSQADVTNGNTPSPLEIQIINKRLSSTGIIVSVMVTSNTQVFNVLISYVVFVPVLNTMIGGQFSYEGFNQISSSALRQLSHTPKASLHQVNSKILGLSGFLIISNDFAISFTGRASQTDLIFTLNDYWKYASYEYFFFLGGACSNCPYYPFSSQGNCVNSCPLGSNLNGTACANICQNGKVYINGNCICPDNTELNGLNCATCTGGKVWSSISRTCACSSNQVWNEQQCLTCGNGRIYDSNLKACACLAGSYWNEVSCITCVGDQIFNHIQKSCVCLPGKIWKSTQCVNKCQNNQAWNINTNKCQCPAGTNQNGALCFSVCRNGQVWITTASQCQCPAGSYWNQVYCSRYADTCPLGTKWNEVSCVTDDSRCQAGCYWTGSSCANIPSQCPSQMIWQQAQGRCLPVGNICPNGTYHNGYSCITYTGCKNNMIWDPSLVKCVCSSGAFWNKNICVQCTGGQIYGGFNGCYCTNGTFWNGSQCLTISSSGCILIPNAVFLNNICDCISGFEKIDFSCVCKGVLIGTTCNRCALKPNSVWNGYNCQCIQGYVDISGVCTQPSNNTNPCNQTISCSVGTFFEKNLQRCILCSDGCLSCQGCYECTQCRPEYNYFAPTKSCVQICGDGVRFSLQCDDNNNINGDGCSSDCKIQAGYTCAGGSPSSRDLCNNALPAAINMNVTGQTHLFGKIVLNVKLNYLPTNYTQMLSKCTVCDNVLNIQINGQNSYVSIKSEYIKSSSYSFGIEIDFGREPIPNFVAQISLNKQLQTKYFSGIDLSKVLTINVNPVFMAVLDGQNDQLI